MDRRKFLTVSGAAAVAAAVPMAESEPAAKVLSDDELVDMLFENQKPLVGNAIVKPEIVFNDMLESLIDNMHEVVDDGTFHISLHTSDAG